MGLIDSNLHQSYKKIKKNKKKTKQNETLQKKLHPFYVQNYILFTSKNYNLCFIFFTVKLPKNTKMVAIFDAHAGEYPQNSGFSLFRFN